jgi:hypothetical protein
MEITCNRCQQPVEAESCYCPACGLPQLVYAAEAGSERAQPEKWNEAVRDAGSVDWKPALRAAMLLAVPAGLLSCEFSPVGILGLFWMSAAAAWAVAMYVRGQRPSWITIGAGARIGLVTGLLAGWVTLAGSGASLFAKRYFLGRGRDFDDPWQDFVGQLSQQWQSMSPDPRTSATLQALAVWLRSPEGRAGSVLGGMALLEVALLTFAAAGGALGARLMARSRRPEI